MKTMNALMKEKPVEGKEWKKGLDFAEVAVPGIKNSDDVLIKVIATAICGTDMGIYQSRDSIRYEMEKTERDRIIIGHEFCGRIVDAGEYAKVKLLDYINSINIQDNIKDDLKKYIKSKREDNLSERDYLFNYIYDNFNVSAEMHITCGNCYQCRLGERHVCQNTKIKGVNDDGSFAEYLVVPVGNIVLFHIAELPVEIISFMDALGNALHTVTSADIGGKNVAILGCGVQGLMATAIARMFGAARIFVTDASNPAKGMTESELYERRFRLARELGADFCFDMGRSDENSKFISEIMRHTGMTGVDVVFEMSGSYKAYYNAFSAVRAGGTICLLGIPEGEFSLNFSREIVFKGVTIKGIIGRKVFDTWETMRRILTSGLSDIFMEKGFITHDLPMSRYEEGFNHIFSRKALKVILRP
ncbi:MAG: zinc-binding dehydrogenase [Fidelibacterota bacterium]